MDQNEQTNEGYNSQPINLTGENPTQAPQRFEKIARLLRGYLRHKKWTIPLTLLIILATITAVPQTRYPILALGLKRSFNVTVIDSKTATPVSGAAVTLDGQTATTDNTGKLSIKARVGKRLLSVSKQYYKSSNQDVFVGISTNHNATMIYLSATGRQVALKVVNKITGQPIANAEIKVLDTGGKTDNNGTATIVLPTNAATQSATITASGYNDLTGNITVTDKVLDTNTFSLTPAGRIYFLSNLSGNIDVVSANLDGSNRKTVLAGTGSEDANNTVLLASRDWKYLSLLSSRDGGKARLYLINTSDDKLTTMDQGNATFTPVGWSNHSFVYQEDRTDLQPWQPGLAVLKSFNADSAQTATIDQTSAQGSSGDYISQSIAFVDLVSDHVVYGFAWSVLYGSVTQNINGKQNSLMSTNADGTNKKDIRDLPIPNGTMYSSMSAILFKPNVLYIQTSIGQQPNIYYTYQYQNDSATQSNTVNDDAYNKAAQSNITYLISPSNKQSFWTEARDGKNTLFVGDYNGDNGQQIATLSNYAPYGWFTDDYLLVQKSDSEIYILPPTGGTAQKISDYYKPPHSFYGYGGGYGGL